MNVSVKDVQERGWFVWVFYCYLKNAELMCLRKLQEFTKHKEMRNWTKKLLLLFIVYCLHPQWWTRYIKRGLLETLGKLLLHIKMCAESVHCLLYQYQDDKWRTSNSVLCVAFKIFEIKFLIVMSNVLTHCIIQSWFYYLTFLTQNVEVFFPTLNGSSPFEHHLAVLQFNSILTVAIQS